MSGSRDTPFEHFRGFDIFVDWQVLLTI